MTDRWLPLQQVPNVRQLGGLLTKDGRAVKRGMLYRGAVLGTASDEDIEALRQLRLKTVIDLRTAFEVEHWPDRLVPGADYINMPIMDEDNNMWVEMSRCPGSNDTEKLLSFAQSEQATAMTKHLYVGFVADEYCQLQYSAFFEKLLMEEEGPVMWHCSQGKDRTGMIAAFLLFALGCDRKTVVADFEMTNEVYQKQVDEITARYSSDERVRNVVQTLVGVKTDYFERALDYIDAEYGSMDRYLAEVVLLYGDDIAELRRRYLVNI